MRGLKSVFFQTLASAVAQGIADTIANTATPILTGLLARKFGLERVVIEVEEESEEEDDDGDGAPVDCDDPEDAPQGARRDVLQRTP